MHTVCHNPYVYKVQTAVSHKNTIGGPAWGNLCAKVAAWRMRRRSRATDFRTSGRCTFTATSPPPYRCVSVARYTCACMYITL